MPADPSIYAQQRPIIPLDVEGIQRAQLIRQKVQQEQADEQAARQQQADVLEMMRRSRKMDEKSGVYTYDTSPLIEKYGVVPEWADKAIKAQEARIKAAHEQMTAVIANDAEDIYGLDGDPKAWEETLNHWEQAKVLTKAEADHYRNITQGDPKKIAALTAKLAGIDPNKGDFTLNSPGAPDARFHGGKEKPYATGLPPPPKPDEPVFVASPDKGGIRQVGSVPAGAHILQAPQPQASSGASAGESAKDKALVAAVVKNPELYNKLTPTDIGRIAVGLSEAGFDFSANAGTGKPPTGIQRQTLAFFNRANQAAEELEKIEPEIAKMGLAGQAGMALLPNFMQSQTGQSYNAAQRAFTEARLRKDSGAAIPTQEFENDRQTYFVQPGDSPETMAQKKRGRAAILASLAYGSGPAFTEFYGDDAKELMGKYRSDMGGKAAGKSGPVTVQGVDGKSYTFPNQAAADAFKKAGG